MTHERRAQTTLPALGVALVLLTVVTGLSLSMADAAIARADREPDERRLAAAVADRLVAADGPLAVRENVLNRTRLDSFNETTLERTVGPTGEYAVSVDLSGSAIARTGTSEGGTRLRRVVLVETRERRTISPNVTAGTGTTLPRRTAEATVTIDPPNGTTVWTVRANDRVVLHDRGGLSGSFEVVLNPYETTRLRFQRAGRLRPGNVTVRYATARSTKGTLEVTVDA